LSSTQIAGRGGEGGYLFETRSRFLAQDTLLRIGAITKMVRRGNYGKYEKDRGDTTFSHLYFDRVGTTQEKEIGRHFELNFEEREM